MDIEVAKQIIYDHLTTKRYEHCLRVAQVAKELAQIHQVDLYKVELAALLHDLAKDQSLDELQANIEQFALPKDLLNDPYEIWHGPVGAEIVKQIYGVKDLDIYDAIYYHTTGRAKMSDVELIVYIADYIEPQRKIPGLEYVRDLARLNLIDAALLITSRTIKYLIDKRVTIHVNTFYAYNDLLKRLTNNHH